MLAHPGLYEGIEVFVEVVEPDERIDDVVQVVKSLVTERYEVDRRIVGVVRCIVEAEVYECLGGNIDLTRPEVEDKIAHKIERKVNFRFQEGRG